jgi:hypothetical protein
MLNALIGLLSRLGFTAIKDQAQESQSFKAIEI